MKNSFAYLLLVVVVLAAFNLTAYSAYDPLGGLSGGKKFDQPTPQPVYIPEDTPVTDMDALTNPQPEPEPQPQPEPEKAKPQPENVDSNSDTDAVSLTFAECLIMEQLEIQDKRCDKLKQAINCPEYTACILDSGKEKDSCFSHCNSGVNSPACKTCRTQYNAGLAVCEAIDPKCTAKYPTEKLTLPPQSSFEILNPNGDVRVTYEDNPKASDMQSIGKDDEALIGATIFTGDKGHVTLQFSDNSTAFVGPGAYFRIDDFYASDKFEQARTFLRNGSVRLMIRANSENENVKYSYVVMTPLWKAKAKGTEFEINVSDDGSEKLETFSGEVEILDYDNNLIETVSAGEIYESKAEEQSNSNLSTTDNGSGITYDFFAEQKKKKIIWALEIISGLIFIGAIYFGIRRFKK